MLRNWITLGAAIALMTAMMAPVAGAQPEDDNGDGKAHGLYREPICHNGHTLYLPALAREAHVRVHGDQEVVCSDVPPGPRAECDIENPVANLPVEVEEAVGDPEIVEVGDVLSIDGDFVVEEPVSVTLGNPDGTQGTFTDNDEATEEDNAEITQDGDKLLIRVTGEPVLMGGTKLKTEELAGVSSEGISCSPLEEDEGAAETEGTTEGPNTTQVEEPVRAEANIPEPGIVADTFVPSGLLKKRPYSGH